MWLFITKQSLSTEETQALVQAMANVEEVRLGGWGEDMTLDISTLVTYGGQGKCKKARRETETGKTVSSQGFLIH